MDWQSPHNKWWIRLVAVTLTIAFIHQDIVWAQEGAPVWSKPANEKWGPAASPPGELSPNGTVPISHNTLNANISIPKDIATVKEAYFPSNRTTQNAERTTIINIQDAHASLEAQESISSILDSLVTNYDLKLVAIEGSSGYIDTSILKTFPIEKIRNSTAKYLMAKGKMSAGEFYSVTSNKNIALYGIEDKSLYKENLEEFKKIYEVNQTVSGDIDSLLKVLNAIKDKTYSPELKALESNSVLKKDGNVSFTERWKYISSLAHKLNSGLIHTNEPGTPTRCDGTPRRCSNGLDITSYPNLSKLEESIKLEKDISFDKANLQSPRRAGWDNRASRPPRTEYRE